MTGCRGIYDQPLNPNERRKVPVTTTPPMRARKRASFLLARVDGRRDESCENSEPQAHRASGSGDRKRLEFTPDGEEVMIGADRRCWRLPGAPRSLLPVRSRGD